MRGFVIGWMLAFAFVGVVALGIGSVFRAAAPPPPTPGPASTRFSEPVGRSAEPFTPEAAIDVVAGRLAGTAKGEQLRAELHRRARVSHHSEQHWTVRWDAASWTAHGPGRYAEPDNDAARQREAEAAAGP